MFYFVDENFVKKKCKGVCTAALQGTNIFSTLYGFAVIYQTRDTTVFHWDRQTDRQTVYLNTEFLQLHGIGFQESRANKNYYNYIYILQYYIRVLLVILETECA